MPESRESDINVGPRLRMTALRYAAQALGARLDGTSDAVTTYQAADVPDEWPDSATWGIGDARFDFQPTFPRFDRREDCAPPHLGLQDILVRMLSLQPV